MVDGSAIAKVEGQKRQRRSIAEKRRIVELAMQPGASMARVAREHGVNANMVHYWRKLYRQGRLGEKQDRQHTSAAGQRERAHSDPVR